jgi:SAM-dependent methyltransferase
LSERELFAGGARFRYRSVVERYRHRAPYPPEVYETLLECLADRPRSVLDAGCGPGKLARVLAPRVERVDAVDPSAEMLRLGRALPGGERSNLRWIHAPIETAPLDGPYGLVCAGASFHWMSADVVLPLFARLLVPGGLLVVLDGDAPLDPPWARAERELYVRLIGRMTDELPAWATADGPLVDLERPLVLHPKFERRGARVTAPVAFEQPVADYVACQHSRQTWCLEAMGPELAAELDRELTALLSAYTSDGRLHFRHAVRIEWGHPLA